MRIDINSRKQTPLTFSGLVPAEQIRALSKQNTIQAKKLLHSCLGFNAVYRGAENVNPDTISRQMADKFQIHTEFGNNPIVACFCALTSNIFHKLGLAQPTNIFLKDLSKTKYYKNTLGICATHSFDTDIYEHLGLTLPLRSVVMNESTDWYSIQSLMIKYKNSNHLSTSHFLAPFIHEYMHSAHFANLVKRYGYGSSIMLKLQKQFKNKDTIYMLQKETGKYGSTSPCEMVAEEMTELIVDSLNPKTIMPNELIFKMNRLKEIFTMDKLLDACWNGDTKQVERFRKRRFSLF